MMHVRFYMGVGPLSFALCCLDCDLGQRVDGDVGSVEPLPGVWGWGRRRTASRGNAALGAARRGVCQGGWGLRIMVGVAVVVGTFESND